MHFDEKKMFVWDSKPIGICQSGTRCECGNSFASHEHQKSD